MGEWERHLVLVPARELEPDRYEEVVNGVHQVDHQLL